ncbi:hypothetical protein [Litoribacillus peritrichatus]|uniref:Nitrate/nitrite sensing protein domain-containing protein n=1 Tax=Litoribacillus peritrichatus TaxID=718191 RepID=A0ABP7M524_9GAMM
MFGAEVIASFILIFSAGMVLVLGGLYLITSYSKTRYQRRSLANYEAVLQLIRLVQQHRGLCQGVISGDALLGSKLSEVQRQIVHLVDVLNHKLEGKSQQRWEGFFDHWLRLSKGSTSAKAEDSFQQHNHMISNLMYLSEDICLNSDLGYGANRSQTQLLWRQLLMLSESLGQSRAIGTSVLTRQETSYLEQIRVQLLFDRIEAHIEYLAGYVSEGTQAKLQACIAPISATLKFISEDISKVSYSGQEFFSVASHSLAQVTGMLDSEIHRVKQSLGHSTSPTVVESVTLQPDDTRVQNRMVFH